MRLHLLSDLHFEFDRDLGDAYIANMQPELADVLVLAGDIGMGQIGVDCVSRILQRYKGKPVVWVHGNHEYYRTTIETMRERSRELEKTYDNLFFLDKDVREIEVAGKKRRFVGCTLWYEDPKGYNWSDFRSIKGFRQWLSREADSCAQFLELNVKGGDIVVTHMLPSQECIHERWRGNPDNVYFVHEMTQLIKARQPAYWLFGHTHDNIDVAIGETKCICAPRGYPYEKASPEGRIIEVED